MTRVSGCSSGVLCVCVCRHEDGTVRFWDASGVCLSPMYKLSTAGVFHTDADPNDNMNQSTEGEWPPFRKVCVKCPSYCVCACVSSGILTQIQVDFN